MEANTLLTQPQIETNVQTPVQHLAPRDSLLTPPFPSNEAAKWITNSRIFTRQRFIAAQQSDTKMFNIQLPQTSQSGSTIPYITSDYFFMLIWMMWKRKGGHYKKVELCVETIPNIPHCFFDRCYYEFAAPIKQNQQPFLISPFAVKKSGKLRDSFLCKITC